ncbi:MAG: hypothetical protein ACE5HL_12975 [Terriglobia bacterium]
MTSHRIHTQRMNGRKAACLLAVCLALGGCQGGLEPLPPAAPAADSPPPPTITVFFCLVSDPQCRSSINSFEVKGTRDLFVFATLPGEQGQREVQFDFLLPGGDLYLPVVVDFDSATAPTSLGDPLAIAVLPVAGTHITQRSLLGSWTVRVSVDGSPAASAVFVLQDSVP